MLVHPALEVDSAPHVGALRLPLEVDFLVLVSVLGVSIGHRSTVDDVFGIAVTRNLPAGTLTGLHTWPFATGP